MKKQLSIINPEEGRCPNGTLRSQLSTVLFVIVYLSLIAVASAATVDETVEHIQKKYNDITDIKGTFSQTSFISDLDRVEKYEGKFFIKKPNSMRWTYSKPRDEEVIIRDIHAWIYRKAEKQALKSTFSKDAYSQIPLAMINSLGKLKNDYDIVMAKTGMLELKPKNRMGFIKKIFLETAEGNFPIKKFSIFDTHGNKIDIEVGGIEINTGLEDSFFIFRAPPGVEVFDFNP